MAIKLNIKFLKKLWADGSKGLEDSAKELNLKPMSIDSFV